MSQLTDEQITTIRNATSQLQRYADTRRTATMLREQFPDAFPPDAWVVYISAPDFWVLKDGTADRYLDWDGAAYGPDYRHPAIARFVSLDDAKAFCEAKELTYRVAE